MKKLAVMVLALMLVAAWSVPVMALENVFGGYWRTRFYTNQNFDGNDAKGQDANDITRVDTRTRIYYTAILNDNLKFVNKFEMDATWGDNDSSGKYGDFGADGVGVEVKNSYVDFTVGSLNAKVGIQGGYLGRGFIMDTDFSGAIVAFNAGGLTIPVIWAKAFDEDNNANGNNKRDVDYFAISPTFNAGGVSINPFGVYAFSDNASTWEPTLAYNNVDIYYAGLNIDANLGAASVWATGIYQMGELELNQPGFPTVDISSYLGAVGFNIGLGGAADLHGQAVYASGDDDATDDEENTYFVPHSLCDSYYWSEIMGYGIFDTQLPSGSPGDQISNIMFANLGTTIKPMSDLKISLDAWWAKLAEENAAGEDDLGIEANVKVTYTLVEGLNLDLVGAYLFAGDAVYKGDDDADPYEIGTRLSLSF